MNFSRECHILAIWVVIVLLTYGSGWLSIDRLLTKRKKKKDIMTMLFRPLPSEKK